MSGQNFLRPHTHYTKPACEHAGTFFLACVFISAQTVQETRAVRGDFYFQQKHLTWGCLIRVKNPAL